MKALLLAAALLLGTGAQAADIVVLSSTGLTSTLTDLQQTFEAKTGDKLVLSFATTGQLKKRIEGGEAFDLCILTAPVIDDLTKSGKLIGARVDLARSGIGVAIKKGAPKPDLSTAEAFKQTILKAKSVAYTSEGASGTYFVGLTERLGIADAVKAKAHTTPGGAAAELVAKGEAEVAIQQISELLGIAGTELAGPLPPELQTITTFSAGVGAQAQNAKGAQALAAFLTTPDAIAMIRVKGMEPGR